MKRRMNNRILRTFLCGACLMGCAVVPFLAPAQTLRTSYFLESMPMRHRLNPALVSDRGYISIPAIGNINVATQSNVGLTAFLYPLPDGGLTTFMNPIVSAETFLGRIKNRNAVQVDADVSLLSSAFYAWSGFNTIDIAVRSSSDIDLPGSLFRFMKLGMDAPEGSSYQMRDLMLQTDNYVEIGLGHAHPVNDRLTLGGKLKVLLGAGSARTHIDRMNVVMNQNKWEVDAQGYFDLSAAGASFETKSDGEINKLDYRNPGVGGWGLAIDLGMSYELVEDHLTLSAGVNDLGFLSWFKNLRGTMQNEPFIFDGFSNIVVDDPNNPGSFKEQWNRLKDDLRDLFRFSGAGASYAHAAPYCECRARIRRPRPENLIRPAFDDTFLYAPGLDRRNVVGQFPSLPLVQCDGDWFGDQLRARVGLAPELYTQRRDALFRLRLHGHPRDPAVDPDGPGDSQLQPGHEHSHRQAARPRFSTGLLPLSLHVVRTA